MKSLEELENEYENYMYLASGLTQDHQQTSRNILLNKAERIKQELYETKLLICEQYKQRKLK